MNLHAARPPRILRSDPVCIDMQQRLRREVDELCSRIERLEGSSAPSHYEMLETYRRVLAKKIAFMKHWGFRG